MSDYEKVIFNYITNGVNDINRLSKIYHIVTKKSESTFFRYFNKLKSRGVFYTVNNTVFLNSRYKFNDLNLYNCKHIILNIIEPS